MRDGLSLLDQAIVYGNGVLNEVDVIDMLGSVAREPVLDLLNALLTQQGAAVLDSIQALDEFAPDYAEVLQSLLMYLHQIAVCQLMGHQTEDESLAQLAEKLGKEEVQLYYQIALMGQKDLPLAPTPKIGFEMVLLRMLAFSPVGNETQQSDFKQSKTQSVLKPQTTSPRLNTQTTEPAVKNRAEPNKSPEQAKKAPKLVIPEKKHLKI